jgi:hypothetical protein
MLAVTDPSAEPPMPRAPDSARESGRGLQIVGALSYVWGWSPIEGHGKAVWAVLKYSALLSGGCAPAPRPPIWVPESLPRGGTPPVRGSRVTPR